MKIKPFLLVALSVSIGLVVLLLIRSQSTGGDIIIIKYATHPALNELEDSFTTNMFAFAASNKLTIKHWNAGGSRQKAKQLAESATTSQAKLLVALATPAAQAVNDTPSAIPLLYGAVADPKGSDLTKSTRSTGIQNAGSNIVFAALSFLKAAFPGISNVGTIYNPNEPNSIYVQKIITEQASLHGIRIHQRRVTSVNQLKSTAEDLLSQVDALYCANDNLVNLGAASVSAAAKESHKPFVIGELSARVYGPTAAIGVDYTSMGEQMALMAKEMLETGKLPTNPHRPPPVAYVWYDEVAIKTLGGSVPASLPHNSLLYK